MGYFKNLKRVFEANVYETWWLFYSQVFLVTNLKALISGLIISKIWYSHSKYETVEPKSLFDI